MNQVTLRKRTAVLVLVAFLSLTGATVTTAVGRGGRPSCHGKRGLLQLRLVLSNGGDNGAI